MLPFVAYLVGALGSTFLVSRAMLWLLRKWDDGKLPFQHGRLYVAHALTSVIIFAAAGFGLADGGPFAGLAAAKYFTPPLLFWLVVDLVRHRAESRDAANS